MGTQEKESAGGGRGEGAVSIFMYMYRASGEKNYDYDACFFFFIGRALLRGPFLTWFLRILSLTISGICSTRPVFVLVVFLRAGRREGREAVVVAGGCTHAGGGGARGGGKIHYQEGRHNYHVESLLKCRV